MHDVSPFRDGAAALLLVLMVTLVLMRLRLPLVSGLVVSGAVLSVLGPEGMKWLSFESELFAGLAEGSVLFLTLVVGLRTPVSTLRDRWQLIAVGGGLQLLLTIVLGTGAAYLIVPDCTFSKAVFVGMLMSTSSTAWVFYQLRAKKEGHSEVGIVADSMLMSHDLILLVFGLLVPKLATDPALRPDGSLVLQIVIGVLALAGVFALEWAVISRVLNYIGKHFEREVFNLTVALIVMVTMYVGMLANLAPAFGSFLGGVLIAKTRYRHHILGFATAVRDLALPIFFLSLGLMVKWEVFVEHWPRIIIGGIGLIGIKFFAATISAWVLGLPLRSAARTGIYLAHIGELAFVLAAAGKRYGLLTGDEVDSMTMLVVASLGLSPLLLSRTVESWLSRVPQIGIRHVLPTDPVWKLVPTKLRGHVVVVGFGRVGERIAGYLAERKLDFIVVDHDTALYDEAKHKGYSPIYGDICLDDVLNAAGVGDAALIVITDGDAAMVRAIRDYLAEDATPPLIVRVNSDEDRGQITTEHPDAVVLTAEGAVQQNLLDALSKALALKFPSTAEGPGVIDATAAKSA
ncbi:MAG: cation:proton antiporter [Bdellovibrionota bacterium]